MKLFVKLLLFIVILALMGPFFIKGPDGKPLWQVNKIQSSVQLGWDRLQRRLTGSVDAAANLPGSGSEVTVHRWQDADGQWHYTQEAPAGIASDILLIDPETNLISLPPLPEPPPVPEDSAAEEPTAAPPVQGPIPTIEETRQLIEDAQALQGQVDERDKKLRDIR